MRADKLRRQNAALRERISALSAAILRICASLDLDTVLAEVLDSARGLTGARYGVIATVDEAGRPGDFVCSATRPPSSASWPAGRKACACSYTCVTCPHRCGWQTSRATSARWEIEPAPRFPGTFQGMPMRHRGIDVGNFFLAEKADGEQFSGDDEELLALFACQAAAAISNVRTDRAEQRARTDLEALVETSSAGVVVFDAQGGRPPSFNREARRIAESLRPPGRSPEQLLEVVSFRRGDAPEVSLSEFPLAQQLGAGETVRAEEVVLSVPDGRSVRTLVNATPIRAAEGLVRSVVVSMQDLAPLDAIERMRTEFLSLVGQELRAPLTAIKGSAVTLLEDAQQLDPGEMREFHRIIVDQAGHMRGLMSDLLGAGRIDAGTLSVAPELADVAALVERARGTLRSRPRSGSRRRFRTCTWPCRSATREQAPELLPHLFRKHVGGRQRSAGTTGRAR